MLIVFYYIYLQLQSSCIYRRKTVGRCKQFWIHRQLQKRWYEFTNILLLSGEQSSYCPEIVEKIWEIVGRGRKTRIAVAHIFFTTERHLFDCSTRSHEITVLIPNCFNLLTHCQQHINANHLRYLTVHRVIIASNSLPLTSRDQSTVLCCVSTVFSAPDPNAQVHYSDHTLSVVRPSSVVNLSHFRLPLGHR